MLAHQPAMLAQQQQQLAISSAVCHSMTSTTCGTISAPWGAPQAVERDAPRLGGDLGGALAARDCLESLLDAGGQRQS
jgi:hypothetical protein